MTRIYFEVARVYLYGTPFGYSEEGETSMELTVDDIMAEIDASRWRWNGDFWAEIVTNKRGQRTDYRRIEIRHAFGWDTRRKRMVGVPLDVLSDELDRIESAKG